MIVLLPNSLCIVRIHRLDIEFVESSIVSFIYIDDVRVLLHDDLNFLDSSFHSIICLRLYDVCVRVQSRATWIQI